MWLRCANVLACHWAYLEPPRYGAAQQFSIGTAADALRASLTSSDETGRSPAVVAIPHQAGCVPAGATDGWLHPRGDTVCLGGSGVSAAREVSIMKHAGAAHRWFRGQDSMASEWDLVRPTWRDVCAISARSRAVSRLR